MAIGRLAGANLERSGGRCPEPLLIPGEAGH
jgi:hypothetical protein